MSHEATIPNVPDVHATRTAALQAALGSALSRHLTVDAALRSQTDDATEGTLQGWKDTYAQTYAEIAETLQQLRALNDAAQWIADNIPAHPLTRSTP